MKRCRERRIKLRLLSPSNKRELNNEIFKSMCQSEVIYYEAVNDSLFSAMLIPQQYPDLLSHKIQDIKFEFDAFHYTNFTFPTFSNRKYFVFDGYTSKDFAIALLEWLNTHTKLKFIKIQFYELWVDSATTNYTQLY